MTYLDLNSLEVALEHGLELHRQYENGELLKSDRPAPFLPCQIPPLVERTFARNQCVECHLIGDFQLIHREQTGVLNKLTDMYRWPDIRTIGMRVGRSQGFGGEGGARCRSGRRYEAGRSHRSPRWQARLDLRRPSILFR